LAGRRRKFEDQVQPNVRRGSSKRRKQSEEPRRRRRRCWQEGGVVFCVAGRLFLPGDTIVIPSPLPFPKSRVHGNRDLVEKSNAFFETALFPLRASVFCLVRADRPNWTKDRSIPRNTITNGYPLRYSCHSFVYAYPRAKYHM